MTPVQIYTDGASRGNPGNAAWAFVIVDAEFKRTLASDSGYIGQGTNNDAEYTAIIQALQRADKLSLFFVDVFSDSEIVVRQLTGQYRCKEPRLQQKKAAVNDLERILSVRFFNVPRENEFIRKCDKLCNETLDLEEVNNEKGNNSKKS